MQCFSSINDRVASLKEGDTKAFMSYFNVHTQPCYSKYVSLNIFIAKYIQQRGWVTKSHNISYDPSPTF